MIEVILNDRLGKKVRVKCNEDDTVGDLKKLVLKPPPPGKVVWAKLARYPWWPAEVLNMSDPYIPDGEEPPRLGAVPVRFFGTYAFSWIESKRAIEPFDDEHMEHAVNSRQPQFQRGVSEAKHFQLTGELPHGFTVALQQFYEEQQKTKSNWLLQTSVARYNLLKAQQTHEQKRREQDYARQELSTYYAQQKAIDTASTAAAKIEGRSRQREAQERQAEAALLQSTQQALYMHQLKRTKAEEEERIAAVLQQRMRESERSAKELQQLRNESAELRDLQEKIKTAKVVMGRAMQLQEHHMMQQREQEYNQALDQSMDDQRLQALQATAAAEAERKANSSKARVELEEQMKERQVLQLQQQAEFARERAQVDAVVASIEEEDRREAAARKAQQVATRDYVQSFVEEQQRLKQQRQQQLDAEDARIQDYLRERQAREDQEAARKAGKKEVADRIYERLKGQAQAEAATREEEDRLVNLLRAEEEAERARSEAEARRQKQERAKLDMLAANERQMQLKAERTAREKAEEDEFRRQTMERFAEQDRLEQMNAQKRRLKVAQHAREVERLIQEKREMYEAAMAAEEEAQRREQAEQDRQAGLNTSTDGMYTDKLHYANYVPGETPLLQDTYPSPRQH
ncbi:hypothetical protein WJX79_004724 [Trebouxia sp. C0005]